VTARRDESDDALPSRVRDLAEPFAEELGVDLVDVEVRGQTGRRVVRLIADSLEVSEGLDVDQIAALSRRVGGVLDETDLIPGAYTLEVTSPGATRPLRRGRDFARNVGREVDVQRLETSGDPATIRGEVVAADDDAVTLRTSDGEVRVALTDVDHGTVVLPW
jgi:ribosome maturation factor RimP